MWQILWVNIWANMTLRTLSRSILGMKASMISRIWFMFGVWANPNRATAVRFIVNINTGTYWGSVRLMG